MRASHRRLRVAGLRSAATGCVAVATVLGTAAAAQAVEPSAFSSAALRCAETNGRVNDIKIMGSTAYLGGSFTQVTAPGGDAFARAGAAAINTSSCAVLPWDPSVVGEVLAIAPTADAVYLGGDFTRVNNARRKNLAAVDPSSGGNTSFAPTVRGKVTELATSGTRLYAVGGITSVNGTSRGKAAAFSLSTGNLDSWAPRADARIDGMDVSPDGATVYLGGVFSTINGVAARNLAAVSAQNGTLDGSFAPQLRPPTTEIRAMSATVAVAYAGRGGQVALLTTGGRVVVSGQADGNVQAVAVRGDEIVAGGHFGNFCPSGDFPCGDDAISRPKAFSLSTSSGELTDFDPGFNSTFGVWAMAYDPATGRLFAGGDFTRVGSRGVDHFAAFSS